MTQEEYNRKIAVYERLMGNDDFKELLTDISCIVDNLINNPADGLAGHFSLAERYQNNEVGIKDFSQYKYKLGYYHGMERTLNYPIEAILSSQKEIEKLKKVQN